MLSFWRDCRWNLKLITLRSDARIHQSRVNWNLHVKSEATQWDSISYNWEVWGMIWVLAPHKSKLPLTRLLSMRDYRANGIKIWSIFGSVLFQRIRYYFLQSWPHVYFVPVVIKREPKKQLEKDLQRRFPWRQYSWRTEWHQNSTRPLQMFGLASWGVDAKVYLPVYT